MTLVALRVVQAADDMLAGQAVRMHDDRCYAFDDPDEADGHVRHSCKAGDYVMVYPGGRYALDDAWAIERFVDWLYDVDVIWPDACTREALIERYRQHRESIAKGGALVKIWSDMVASEDWLPVGSVVRVTLRESRVGTKFMTYNGMGGVVVRCNDDGTVDVGINGWGVITFERDEVERGQYEYVFVPLGKRVEIV